MPRPRPGKHARFIKLLEEIRKDRPSRARYLEGVGIRSGGKTETAYLKIRLPNGGQYRQKYYKPGSAIELSLGRLSSWPWDRLLQERDRLQGLADRGEPLEEKTTDTFREAAMTWLNTKRNVPSHTLMKGHIENYLLPTFGQIPLDQIDLDHIHLWQANLLEDLSPATVKRIRGTFSTILAYQVRKGTLDRNWVKYADPIRGIEPRTRHLTREEVGKILEAARKLEGLKDKAEPWKHTAPWLEDFIRWQLATGMRKGEALRLKWSDIDRTSNQPCVRISQTKTGQPRAVPLGSTTLSILDRMMEYPRAENDRRIFPVSLSTVTRTLKLLWDKSDIEDVRLHDLRRTCLTWLAGDGIDLRTVQSIAGHADLNMLQRHYAQPLNHQAAAIAMEERFKAIG
ncbi:MAG: hypothetical protein DHS20C06_00380 [Hyphobacterium sp.]|nr:MAG: hypothetical protein DHS20C06_00380 [Hyphobacterium sp.]